MSTLKELIQDVNTILDYNPDLESYRKQVGRALNRHYEEISGQLPWLFLQKIVPLQVYAKVTGTSSITVDVDGTNRREVLGTGTAFQSGMEGHEITINGVTANIVYVASTTVLYVDANYSTSDVSGPTEDWSVTFSAYAMPPDCGEVLGMMNRSDLRGRISFVDARKEEQHFLNADVTGTPTVSIEQPSEFAQAPSIEGTSPGAGGSLTAGTTYEYMYTMVSGGMESPPSRVVSAVAGASAGKIHLDGMQDLDYATGKWSGRRWRIYRRSVDASGTASPYYRLDVVSGPSAGTQYTDDGSIVPDYETTIFIERGFQQRLRMWFTPNADLELEIRYQSVPRRLQSDDDQPQWPKQYHHLLVYRALQDAAAQSGATTLSQLYEKRADTLLTHMRQRWLTRSDRDYVKRGFDKNLAFNAQTTRWGVPSKS